MMHIRLRIGLAVMLCLALTAVQAAGVQASLDRNQVSLGDTVTLTLRTPGASLPSAPDLSPLQKDFQVLGQARTSEQSWVNGQVQSSSALQIQLRPLHAGIIRIPSLTLGNQHTAPLVLHVAQGSTRASGKPGDPVFIQVSLSSHAPYVGEQVAMDVRLFYRDALVSGSPPVPNIVGASVMQMGRMQRYQTVRGGESYLVAEQHFAVVPEHAGKLVILPMVFQGQMMVNSQLGGFFGNVKPVSARSGEQVLTVRPRPSSAPAGAWLPARQLALNLDGWPASGKVQVGQPITLTLRIGATGLMASALPEPALPPLSGADVYPGKSQDVTHSSGSWLTGSRTRSFAVVPDRSGTLTLPAITLQWWNVVDNRVETASIPQQTLTVVAGHAAAPAATGSAPTAQAGPATTSTAAGSVLAATRASPGPGSSAALAGVRSPELSVWRTVAWVLGGLWLLTVIVILLVWWRWRRHKAAMQGQFREPQPEVRTRSLRNAFIAAVRRNDLKACASTLLAWARSERPAVQGLSQLAAMLQEGTQTQAIEALQQTLYAQRSDHDDLSGKLAKAFDKGLAWRDSAGHPGDDALPPLYPRHR